MPDYSKCVIYKLCCKDLNVKELYIGSTCNFTKRKWGHKLCCNSEQNKEYNRKVYKFIRDNGGWDNWDMILVEEYSCENKQQKLQRERYWYEELKAELNKECPGREKKEYHETHKEQKKEYNKEYYEENREKILEQKKEKITCECGSTFTKCTKLRHERSIKHLDFIN